MSKTIDALYEAAQKATPGPWTYVPDEGAVYDASGVSVMAWEDDDGTDSAYLALADPQTVMAVIEAYRAAKALVGVERTCKHDGECGWTRAQTAVAKVEALG